MIPTIPWRIDWEVVFEKSIYDAEEMKGEYKVIRRREEGLVCSCVRSDMGSEMSIHRPHRRTAVAV